MKFLIVDDSAVDRHLMVNLLEQLGHQADTCESTQGVIDKIVNGNYAALVLDIVMPEQDGYKFLRELRSNPTTAKQHVILCSAKKTPIEINYGLKRAGADDYLTKPATVESLQDILQKM